MLNILFTSGFVFSIILFTGIPISAITFLQKKNPNNFSWITLIAVSLVIGFGIMAISVAYAYGFLGMNNFFLIMICFGAISWILLIKYKKNIVFPKKDKNSIYYLIPSVALALYFVSSQWDSSLKPIIKSGLGPDVSQNLMAAQVANKLGSTWSTSSNNLIGTLGVSDIDQAAVEIFRAPSFKEVAGYDYLVYGGRWTLTIMYNQILRIFGPQAIMWEIGTILFTTLTALSIIFFAGSKIITKSNVISCAITLSVISNANFLFQYFNGGISQAFGTIGLSGLFLALMLLSKYEEYFESKARKAGLFIISLASWLGSSITYIDATFIYILFLIVFLVICIIKSRVLFTRFFNFLVLPGIAAVVIVPNFIYTIIVNLSYRSAAASGTGTTTGIWKTPSQLVGIFNVFSITADNQSKITFYSSIILTFIILFFFIKKLVFNNSKNFIIANIAMSSAAVISVGFILSFFGTSKSDYIYNKIAGYLAPLIIFSLLILITEQFKNSKSSIIPKLIFSLIPITIVVSGIQFIGKLNASTEAVIIPAAYSKLLQDQNLETYLGAKNYLAPYKPVYNFAGLFGAEYWVSKAPNDMKLDSRINNQLAIFCFTGDVACKPITEKITNIYLEKYGILEFKTSLTTEQFSKLSIIEKYNYNFDSIGMPRSEVPEKYLGGNPYLK
jgi:hypothetical protein